MVITKSINYHNSTSYQRCQMSLSKHYQKLQDNRHVGNNYSLVCYYMDSFSQEFNRRLLEDRAVIVRSCFTHTLSRTFNEDSQ